ncbi:MAG: PocR ligand-binding domain-containing protein [Verrucomicrobiota bacterium]
MKELTFDELSRLPILKQYEKAFRKATGVSLKLLPPDEKKRRANLRQSENPFCAFVASTPAGCEACLETQRRIEKSTAAELVAQQVYCFAGLTDIAIPVVIGGRHVATLLSGQIFRREPTRRDFEAMMKKLGEFRDKDWEKMARKSYFETPVVPQDTLDAVIQLLTVFAQHLADDIGRHMVAARPDLEPAVVSGAKKFVEAHSQEPLTLDQVLQHVHAGRFHFCKIFKKTTGITFTEYVARVRVEKAKALLMDPSLRVSEVVFTSGFGSIPQFNSVFKRIVGKSPTEFRGRLEGSSQIADGRANTGADEDDVPDNVIRAAAFRRDEDPAVLPANIIRPRLNQNPRRTARA